MGTILAVLMHRCKTPVRAKRLKVQPNAACKGVLRYSPARETSAEPTTCSGNKPTGKGKYIMSYLPESIQLQTIEPGQVASLDDHKGTSGASVPAARTVIQLAEGVEVTPMYEENGQANFSDKILGQIFRRIVREEIVYKLFYDGSVRNTQDFREFIQNPDHQMFFVKFNGKEVGFFWLINFRQKSFFINYCLYKEFLGETALTISKICIDYIFKRSNTDGDYLVDVLLGLTPDNNRLAVNFLLKNDMTILGKVPGFLYDSIEDKTVAGIFSYRQRIKKAGFKMPSMFLI